MDIIHRKEIYSVKKNVSMTIFHNRQRAKELYYI